MESNGSVIAPQTAARKGKKRLRDMLLAVQIYICSVMASGVAVLLLLSLRVSTVEPSSILLTFLCALVLLVTHTHQIPVSYKINISVSTAVIFAAILLLGPALACWATALGVGLASIYLKRKWFNVTFNTAAYVLTVASASLTYQFASDGEIAVYSLTNIPALSLAAIVYFVANSGLVAGVVALREKRDVWYVWTDMFRQAAPQYLALILLGVLTAMVYGYAWWAIALIALPVVIVYHSLNTSQALRVQTKEAIEALADTMDSRDPYTFRHSQRVAQYAEKIAIQLGLPPEEVDLIRSSARIHDLGKMGIDDQMLRKPGPLTVEERSEFQGHSAIGAEIVQRFPQYKDGRKLILYHHERYDGSGYPEGLEGDQIPLGARIIAVADAYDAMTSDRPYRKALSPDAACDELSANGRTQFDPVVVGAFFKIPTAEIEAVRA
jgi:putative nucleotidyltransferase with HDIG domain